MRFPLNGWNNLTTNVTILNNPDLLQNPRSGITLRNYDPKIGAKVLELLQSSSQPYLYLKIQHISSFLHEASPSDNFTFDIKDIYGPCKQSHTNLNF